MAKGNVTLSDFPVAARRQRPVESSETTTEIAPENNSTSILEDSAQVNSSLEQIPVKERSNNLSITPDERRARAIEKANRSEDSRNRLRDLRKSRVRESKHFVNVPLDYETKRRLEKAAHDNDLKMTVIMRDAIDQYLAQNGY